MLKAISDIFRSDEFVPSSAVFPDIDIKRIEQELKLGDEGRKRGSAGLPESGETSLDPIEHSAVRRIEELRRRGLENFETNRRVYEERLNQASAARLQVETEANDSKSRFVQEVTTWKALMVTPRERVQETFRWRNEFRRLNKLVRPARPASSWASIIGLSVVMISLESVMNAYLFSQNNPLGLLGGLFAALLVSVANVAMSTFLGMCVRFVNCIWRQPIKKLFGLFAAIAWLAFALTYNLAVAHFRDAVETIDSWRAAGEAAVQSMLTSPLPLETMESYILLVIGFIISVAAFLKGYNSSDPYPGYSRVSHDVVEARQDYIDHLEDSIADLAEHRDNAVQALRDANDEVHRNISDSIDALYGQKALISGLGPFLQQCDLAVSHLLSVYRDANKAARSDTPPSSFTKPFSFEKFEPPMVDEKRREEAEMQVRQVAEMVQTAIEDIFEVFRVAVNSHYEIDELEGTKIPRRNDTVPVVSSLDHTEVAADGQAPA